MSTNYPPQLSHLSKRVTSFSISCRYQSVPFVISHRVTAVSTSPPSSAAKILLLHWKQIKSPDARSGLYPRSSNILVLPTILTRHVNLFSDQLSYNGNTVFDRVICAPPPRILRTLIFKGWFWIYFCSAYFTHHCIVHLPATSLRSHLL